MNIRVTQNSLTRGYKRSYNSSLSKMNDIQSKLLTQRKFLRASENPINAARALSIRRNLSDNEVYTDNLNTAEGIFNTAESTLTNTVSTQLTTVTTQINAGANGDKGPDERKIIATQIRGIADDLIKTMNSEYAGRKLYGGTNNSTSPFTYDKITNKVSYNGTYVNEVLKKTEIGLGTYTKIDTADVGNIADTDTIYVSDGGGAFHVASAAEIAQIKTGVPASLDGYREDVETKYTFDGKDVDPAEVNVDQAGYKFFNGSNPILIDVGIGVQYQNDGTVDPSTAMDISINGAEITGCGVDADGDSQNFLQLCYDAADALEKGESIKALGLMDKITASKSNLLVSINNLGVKQKTIDYYQDKISVDDTNLKASQVTQEGMSLEDQAAAMTDFKTIEAAYNAILQMGSKVVPRSIFDFIS